MYFYTLISSLIIAEKQQKQLCSVKLGVPIADACIAEITNDPLRITEQATTFSVSSAIQRVLKLFFANFY